MSEPQQPTGAGWPVETTVPDARDASRDSDRADSEPRADTANEATAEAEAAGEAAGESIDASVDASSGPRTDEHAVQPDLAALERAAVAVQPSAYAPYSRFQVGAAVFGEGREFLGVNVENASFGLTICAERNAVAHAVTSGVQRLTAVAVCTSVSPPSSPCGSCRQVLAELADDPRTFRVVAVNPLGERREWTLDQLLPDSFTRAELPGSGEQTGSVGPGGE
jgi:cytidine deaminase